MQSKVLKTRMFWPIPAPSFHRDHPSACLPHPTHRPSALLYTLECLHICAVAPQPNATASWTI